MHPLQNICSKQFLQPCVAETDSGTSGVDAAEGQVLKAWLATCETYQQTNDVNAANACWTAGGSGSSCVGGSQLITGDGSSATGSGSDGGNGASGGTTGGGGSSQTSEAVDNTARIGAWLAFIAAIAVTL